MRIGVPPHTPPFFFSPWFRSRFEKRERQERGKGRRADQTCRNTGRAPHDEDEGHDDKGDELGRSCPPEAFERFRKSAA